MEFLLPGIGTTAFVAVVAYIVASILGLILAGLQMLKLGDNTLRNFLIGSLVLAAGAAFFFTRPQLEYSLVGEGGGRVAIIQGTPASASERITKGDYEGSVGPLQVRAVVDTAAALERIETGVVSAAFIPSAEVPPGMPVIHETTFLAPSLQRPAMLLAVLGFFGLALTFAASQSGHHPLRLVAELYVDVLRGIPMLVVILYVGFPLQGAIRDATGGFIDMSRLTRGVVGISLGYAAYMAEIFR
ncbi:MAG: ABC transporter permease subunit, partial [Trueperaceae bacterium]